MCSFCLIINFFWWNYKVLCFLVLMGYFLFLKFLIALFIHSFICSFMFLMLIEERYRFELYTWWFKYQNFKLISNRYTDLELYGNEAINYDLVLNLFWFMSILQNPIANRTKKFNLFWYWTEPYWCQPLCKLF